MLKTMKGGAKLDRYLASPAGVVVGIGYFNGVQRGAAST